VFGVGLSIPLIVFGSSAFLWLMQRFTIIVWAGAALLGWIAGDLIVSDPKVADWLGAWSGPGASARRAGRRGDRGRRRAFRALAASAGNLISAATARWARAWGRVARRNRADPSRRSARACAAGRSDPAAQYRTPPSTSNAMTATRLTVVRRL
jgi:hypothetical protein